MRLTSMLMAGAMAGFLLAPGARAAEAGTGPAQALPTPQSLVQGLVREDDVALLFAHLRAALLAAHEGRAAPPAKALERRAQAIAGELQTRAALAGLQLLSAIEAAARESLREHPEAPFPEAR